MDPFLTFDANANVTYEQDFRAQSNAYSFYLNKLATFLEVLELTQLILLKLPSHVTKEQTNSNCFNSECMPFTSKENNSMIS